MERWVAGRERLYLDHFWNDVGADPAAFGEETRAHDAALYGLPGGMRAGFAQVAAFARDAADNRGFLEQGKLTIPVLAVGGEASGGAMVETLMRYVADQVEGAVVSAAAHWLLQENPEETVTLAPRFLTPAGITALVHEALAFASREQRVMRLLPADILLRKSSARPSRPRPRAAACTRR